MSSSDMSLEARSAAMAGQKAPAIRQTDDPVKARKVAQELEAFVLGQMLQPMFEDMDVDETFGGGSSEKIWRSMQVEEYGKAMASHAPAFGMVGTLVGMVIMLGNFSDDMSGVGRGLAISLLATLYGVITARMLYMPAAAKLTQKQEGLRFRNYLIAEGMSMLVENRSPRYIQDRLNSYLRPERQHNMDAVEPLKITEV